MAEILKPLKLFCTLTDLTDMWCPNSDVRNFIEIYIEFGRYCGHAHANTNENIFQLALSKRILPASLAHPIIYGSFPSLQNINTRIIKNFFNTKGISLT